MVKRHSFKECLKERRAFYKAIGTLRCNILNEDVVFNSRGFYHLRHDNSSRGRSRSIPSYHNRLWLLPLSEQVLQQATNIHEYKPKKYFKDLEKYCEVWELRSDTKLLEITGKRTFNVSVVLRRIGNGNIQFCSIWRNGK